MDPGPTAIVAAFSTFLGAQGADLPGGILDDLVHGNGRPIVVRCAMHRFVEPAVGSRTTILVPEALAGDAKEHSIMTSQTSLAGVGYIEAALWQSSTGSVSGPRGVPICRW